MQFGRDRASVSGQVCVRGIAYLDLKSENCLIDQQAGTLAARCPSQFFQPAPRATSR